MTNQFEWDIAPTGGQTPPPPPPFRPNTPRRPSGDPSLHQNIVRWMWRIAIGSVVGVLLLLLLLSFSNLPTFDELENPANNTASEIYAADGSVLGRYFLENRVPVAYNKLSPYLVRAVIATEDERFYEHSGIDVRALGRVAKGIVTLHPKGGGSTITQQLAKLLYSDRDFSGMGTIRKFFSLATKKLKEWITAVKLERSYTKEEIIQMYFNQFNFINGAYGIRAASEIYFGKSQDSLKIEEAATLVGMLQNPALYNPIRRPDRCVQRRNIVLGQMYKNDLIKANEYNKLKDKPLDISRFKRSSHADGIATYFRMELRKELDSLLSRPEYRKPDGSKYNLFTDGLKIHTTIDPATQRHAEVTMKEHMAEVQSRFFRAWKGKDPWTYKSANTTSAELEYRQRSLRRSIRESERYQALRSQYLPEVVQTIESQIPDFELKDSDVDRMMAEEKTPGSLNKDRTIPAEQIARYRQIMKSTMWATLKSKWTTLQTAVTKTFSTPVRMTVFSYNARNETDTMMSPLDSIRYHKMFLQIGSLAVDPATGFVKSWVGGINHKYFQYDHVNQKTQRQVGSTFKPFVYATAIAMQGTSPCYTVLDQPQTIKVGEGQFHLSKDWTPHNAEGGYSYASLTLKDGLKLSKNTVSVFLMKQLQSPEPVRNLISNMGIDTSRVPHQPSICLGSADLSPYEMTGAYTTFANEGIYNRPVFIQRVTDKNGRMIYQGLSEERPALDPKANYVMLQMLKYVMSGASGFAGVKSEIGGKTGTTNDFADGWFMGVTPSLVVGTWVGGEDRWIHFLNIAEGQGARMARPYFAKLLRKLEADKNVDYDANARFKRPAGDLGIEMDCGQYSKDELDATGIGGGNKSDFAPDFQSDDIPNATPKKKSDDDDFGG